MSTYKPLLLCLLLGRVLGSLLLHSVPTPNGCIITHGDEDVTIAGKGCLADWCHTLGVGKGGAAGLRRIPDVQVPNIGPTKLVPHRHHLWDLYVVNPTF